MDIVICCYEKDAFPILEDVKTRFTQKFPDSPIQWESTDNEVRTSLLVGEEEITSLFRNLISQYPRLSVMAADSREIRPDDRSAQWWSTTKIYSETENGETRIVRSSSTYWN